MVAALTPAERVVVGAYLRARADDLGLRDWTLEFMHEPARDGISAMLGAVYGRRLARLNLAHGFRGATPEEQRDTIVHELLHVHREAIRHFLDETLDTLIGKLAATAFAETYRLLDETATDALAGAIAHFFPLIEWPTPAPAGVNPIDNTGGS